MEDSQNSEEKCKMVKDIRKYFSEEEWANMGKSEKLTYVSMKKSYEIMTSLGLTAKLPDFMRPKNRATEFPEHNSDEAQNPGNQDFPGTSGVSQDFGNLKQQRTPLLYQLLTGEPPPEASNIEPRKHLKESPKSEGPQSLSLCTNVNMMMPVKETREENYLKPLPVTPDAEPAQKLLCPPAKGMDVGQPKKELPGIRKEKTNVWAHRLRERKYHIVYEEISDPEEDD